MPRWKRIARGIIAAVTIGSLLYISGIYQAIFLHRTSPDLVQPILPSKVEAPEAVVPVSIYILSGQSGSGRTEEDAYRLVENANNVWAQANITFQIQEVRHISVTTSDLILFEQQPHAYIRESGSYNPEVINVYLTRTLQGVNGLAYGGIGAVSVADYTSTLDFRTLAHEFGHILGLDHVQDTKQLMSTGASGVELTEEEIRIAREVAG